MQNVNIPVNNLCVHLFLRSETYAWHCDLPHSFATVPG